MTNNSTEIDIVEKNKNDNIIELFASEITLKINEDPTSYETLIEDINEAFKYSSKKDYTLTVKIMSTGVMYFYLFSCVDVLLDC